MIRGLGVDLVEVARIERHCRDGDEGEDGDDRFIERIFTPTEIAYCRDQHAPALHFAGRFAAKEAIMKMLATGWTEGISWQELEIRPGPAGAPRAALAGRARELAMQAGIDKVHVTISHTDDHAVACAVGEAG